MPIADPRNRAIFETQDKAMLHCDLRVRWKVASDLRVWAAISEPETSSFCGISGDLAQSMRKSLAIAIVRFWCATPESLEKVSKMSVRDFFETFSSLFGTPGPGARETLFRLFWDFGPGGPERLL